MVPVARPVPGGPGVPRLSVVIPVLNEEWSLPGILGDLARQKDIDAEIVVSDGGSTDGTRRVALEYGVTFLEGPPGRAMQLNAGARQARGSFLLFLHADSRLTDEQALARSVSFLESRIQEHGHDRIAGHFRLRFMRTQTKGGLAYAYMEAKSALSREGTTNGDQGYLLSAAYYRALEGFEESLPFLEDQRLAERIRRTGAWVTLPGLVKTSARRFEKDGLAKRYLMMAVMMGCHHAELHEFFHGARNLYAAHHVAGVFRVSPYFDLIQKTLLERSGQERCLFWLDIGRYVRRNAWQIFFLADVLIGLAFGRTSTHPITRFFDAALAPVLNCRIFDVSTSGLVFIWFHCLVRPWYRFREQF